MSASALLRTAFSRPPFLTPSLPSTLALRPLLPTPSPFLPLFSRGLLQPARTKWRKHHKGRVYGYASRGTEVSFGKFGLQGLQPVRMTAAQIESARRAITRKIRRTGRLIVRVFPDISVSKKPAEVRMGKGKGAHEQWVARVKANRMLFELDGVSAELAKEAFSLAADKLPIRTRFVERQMDAAAIAALEAAKKVAEEEAAKKAAAQAARAAAVQVDEAAALVAALNKAEGAPKKASPAAAPAENAKAAAAKAAKAAAQAPKADAKKK